MGLMVLKMNSGQNSSMLEIHGNLQAGKLSVASEKLACVGQSTALYAGSMVTGAGHVSPALVPGA